MLKNKKADASAIILILIIIFFLAISFLIVNYVGTEFTWIMRNTVLNETAETATVADAMENVTTNTIDNGFVLMYAFLIIGIIISGFLIRIHPAWLFLYIIFLAVGIFLGVFLGNAYQKVTEVGALSGAVANMPKTVWIMKNLLISMLATGALSMVVIFSKIFGRGGYTERV